MQCQATTTAQDLRNAISCSRELVQGEGSTWNMRRDADRSAKNQNGDQGSSGVSHHIQVQLQPTSAEATLTFHVERMSQILPWLDSGAAPLALWLTEPNQSKPTSVDRQNAV